MLWYQLGQESINLPLIICFTGCGQLVEHLLELSKIHAATLGQKDLRVCRSGKIFGFMKQLFVEFFTRTQAGVDDFNILA